MEQILIYKPNGDSETINSNSLVSVITQAEHKKALLGEDVISMTVESASVRNFAIGDYIKIFGLSKYKINQLPKVTKISERKYQYDLIFEGLQYDLLRVAYRNTDISSFNNSSDFSLIGNLEMFLNVLINNLNRVFGENKWALGDFPEGTETKTLSFNNENCLAVLQRLCDEYKYQFTCEEGLTQNTLNVKSVGTALDYNFKYGQGKGLYTLTRENIDSKNIVNTLWAYGSSKNLPADYKNYSPRLRLGETIDLPILETVSRAKYGIFEGSVVFDDIFPHRLGTVTAINTENRLLFTDGDMDFDLNASSGGNTLYLIPGNTAKIRFQTGNLAGFEFEVVKYAHDERTFTLKLNKDDKGLEMPSATESAFQIGVGDTYIMVDIIMPATYIGNAEDQLAIRASEYLSNNSTPTLKYSLTLDEFFLRDTAESINVFEVGDTVSVEDGDLSINTRIKIAEYTRDILRPYSYNLTIQDTPQTGILKNVLIQFKKYNKIIKERNLDDSFRPPKDWVATNTIVDEVLNEETDVVIGRRTAKVDLGNDDSEITVRGGFGITNVAGKKTDFDVAVLTQDRQVAFPDQDIVVNDWNYIIGLPESFPSLSSDYGVIGDQDGINKVFNTSSSFVTGSTIVHINGIRQFRGLTGDYVETSDNEISFTLAPYIDDRIIVDYQKI